MKNVLGYIKGAATCDSKINFEDYFTSNEKLNE